MAKGIHKTAVIPVEATLLSIAIILTSIRLVLRLIIQRTKLTISDYLLVASTVNAIALFSTDAMAYSLGAMDDYDPDAPVDLAKEERLMKVEFSGNYFYDTGVYFPKLALLAFYFRLIPPTMPFLRKLLYFATGLTCVFAITTCFIDTFWCGAGVSVNWNYDGTCSTYTSNTVTKIDWSMNIVSDLLIFSIPFPLLKGLNVNRRYMIGLIATFSSGLITVVTSVVRFATVTAIHAWTNVYVLSMTEMVAAILVVCLPSLKALVAHGIEQSSSNRASKANKSSGYNKYATPSSHMKLSSGRDTYNTTTTRVAGSGEDSGSEVELNTMSRNDVIYKTEQVSITYQNRKE